MRAPGPASSNGIGSPSTISCLGFSSWEVSLEMLAHSFETLGVLPSRLQSQGVCFCWLWSEPGALQSWEWAQSSGVCAWLA